MMQREFSSRAVPKTASSSPRKRQKVSDEQEITASASSQFLLEVVSQVDTQKESKSNLKGEADFKPNKAMLKKPKKNITAYAFFIKEVIYSIVFRFYNLLIM